MRGECLTELPELLLHLICVVCQLPLDGRGFRGRRFEESAIRAGLVAGYQIAPAGQLKLPLLKCLVGSLLSQLCIHAAARIRAGLGGRAGGRTVRGSGTHTLQDGGTRAKKKDNEESRSNPHEPISKKPGGIRDPAGENPGVQLGERDVGLGVFDEG